MDDTPPEVRALFRRMLMERSGEERMLMGFEMHEFARQMVLASLPKGMSEAERRYALFLRFYSNDFDAATKRKIRDAIAGALGPAAPARAIPPV